MRIFLKIGAAFFLIMTMFFTPVAGQVLRPFAPTASVNSPGRVIYNINGDFTMLGNTSLTLENYSLDLQNNLPMVFVDVDDDPNTFNSSSATLTFSNENGADPSCTNILFAGLYWSGRSFAGLSADVEKDGVTKTMHKQEIKIKGPGQTEYLQLRSSPNDLWYPNSMEEQFGMYAGFVEITDYVKASGSGSYTVADLALIEGPGGSVGYFGGWGMVVVYENHLMKQRDVVLFNGFAFVAPFLSEDYLLSLEGFSAMEAGAVNLKMGIMAGEGDRGGVGDYFEIERGVLSGDFLRLSHSMNQEDNFFNASINTGGNPREPNLENNTGIDIAMFTVPNPNNSVITNGQTSTRFRYGTNIDTYIIYNITFAIDADRPQVEGLHTLQSAHTLADDETSFMISPGDELQFRLDIRNKGTEGIRDGKVVIPIPLSASFQEASFEVFFNPNTIGQPYYDAALGAGGSLVWEIGDLPVSQDPETLLASLTYSLKAAESCAAFSGFSCDPSVNIAGEISGINLQTQAPFSGIKIIRGYLNASECSSSPIVDPYEFIIDKEGLSLEDCEEDEITQVFDFCNVEDEFLPVDEIASAFPPETRFFNEFPITFSSIEYTSRNPFPLPIGISEYYAVLRGENDCFQKFAINHEPVTVVANVSSDYNGVDISCFGESNATVQLEITGGKEPYIITWNDEVITSMQIENLSVGTYRVGVTDSKGCEVTMEVTVEQPDRLVLVPNLGQSSLAVSCYGLSDGEYAVDVTGGVGPFSTEVFRVNEGGDSTSVSKLENQSNRNLTFTGLSPGTYVYRLVDANGCSDQQSFIVTSPEPYFLTAEISNAVDCKVANTGMIDVIPVGGVGPFEYDWDHGPNRSTLENLASGVYTVNVTDVNGCVVSESFEIEEQIPLSVAVTSTEEIVCGTRALKTTYFLDVQGGFPPYSINWSGGSIVNNGLEMIASDPGNYSATVVDSQGCSITTSMQVAARPFEADFSFLSSSVATYSSNLVNYSIQFTPATVGEVIAYEWDFGDGNKSQEQRPTHTFGQEGLFPVSLTITDSFGCQLTETKDILIEEAFILTPNGFTPNANGTNDYFFPKFNYITDLELWVFNKWGEAIFHTEDTNGPGWDGTFRDELAPAGNYVYKLRYTTPDGRVKEETDVFVLIR